jgi:hypothetical protein
VLDARSEQTTHKINVEPSVMRKGAMLWAAGSDA